MTRSQLQDALTALNEAYRTGNLSRHDWITQTQQLVPYAARIGLELSVRLTCTCPKCS